MRRSLAREHVATFIELSTEVRRFPKSVRWHATSLRMGDGGDDSQVVQALERISGLVARAARGTAIGPRVMRLLRMAVKIADCPASFNNRTVYVMRGGRERFNSRFPA